MVCYSLQHVRKKWWLSEFLDKLSKKKKNSGWQPCFNVMRPDLSSWKPSVYPFDMLGEDFGCIPPLGKPLPNKKYQNETLDGNICIRCLWYMFCTVGFQEDVLCFFILINVSQFSSQEDAFSVENSQGVGVSLRTGSKSTDLTQ